MSTSKCVLIHGFFGSAIAAWLMTIGMIALVQAQSAQIEAKVTAVSGNAMVTTRSSGLSSPIRRGDRLLPGDEIETHRSGRVILTLTDGSQVIIRPNSRVVIKDFRAVATARELIDVLVGYVRVKIYHVGKRPNPYRVNTPLASIAVRGTSFGVEVAITGETRVTVFEGLVEVTSQANPQQKRLLSPGRSVVVRPSGDIGLLAPGPGSELNAGSPGMVRTMIAEYSGNIVSPAKTVPFERFIAFGDPHFDSQENPAYAADFTKPAGRFYLLPSFGASEQFNYSANSGQTDPEPGDKVRPFNYTIVNQTSYFAPIRGTKVILGGILTLAHTNAQSGWSYSGLFDDYSHNSTEKADLSTFNLSLVVARRFGTSERTGLGVQFEQLEGRVHAERNIVDKVPGRDPKHYQALVRGRVKRSRLTVGMTHDLAEGKKLGIYYRYGVGSSKGNDRLDYGVLQSIDSGTPTGTSAQNSEIGARWRSPLTKRLFYGLHSSVLFENAKTNFGTFEIRKDNSSKRVIFGAGVGYAIRPQTTIAFDVAGGLLRGTENQTYRQDGPTYIDRYETRFVSIHTGGQTDLGRHFFVNGSLFLGRNMYQYEYYSSFQSSVQDAINASYKGSYFLNRAITNLGPGWRITKNLHSQYILSRSSGSGRNSHSVMLQFNFGSDDQ